MSNTVKCPCCKGAGEIYKEYNEALSLFGGIDNHAEESLVSAVDAVIGANRVRKSKEKHARKMLYDLIGRLKSGI